MKNKIGIALMTFALFLSCFMAVLADTSILLNENTTGSSDSNGIYAVHPAASGVSAMGQTFSAGSIDMNITSVLFKIRKAGTPIGYLKAAVYNITGTLGTDGEPVESERIEVSTNALAMESTTTSYVEYTFNFSGSTILNAGQNYAVALYAENATQLSNSPTHKIYMAYTSTTTVHPGNRVMYLNDAWTSAYTGDIVFSVYAVSNTDHGSVVDSYTPTHLADKIGIKDFHPAVLYTSAVSQAFRPNDTGPASFAMFYINKVGSPVGNLTAKICGATGSYGASMVPNETETYAYSTNMFSMANIKTSVLPYYFTFDSSLGDILVNSTACTLVVYAANGSTLDTSNYINIWYDTTTTHNGNLGLYNSGAWGVGTYGDDDFAFELFSSPTASPTPTPTPTPAPTPSPTPVAGPPSTFYLFGAYNETTGLKTNQNVTVQVYFSTAGVPYEEFTFNSSIIYNASYPVRYFHFDVNPEDAYDREYWISGADNAQDDLTIYVFNDTLSTYVINFMDLVGGLEDYPYVESRFYINGTLMTMDRRKVDEEGSVAMSLVNGRKYQIVLYSEDETSSYVYGDVLMTDDDTVQLVLRGVDFPKENLLIYKYVRTYAYRSFGDPYGTIYVAYNDLKENTNGVHIDIKYSNGSVVDSSDYYADSFTYAWSYADNLTDYVVEVSIDHGTYGEYTWRQLLVGSLGNLDAPFSLDFLGVFPFTSAYIIPALLIFLVAGCFSVLNAEVGAVLTVITAIILTYLQWIPIGTGALVTAFAFALIMAIGYAKRRVLVS